jgi:hypothetical protein
MVVIGAMWGDGFIGKIGDWAGDDFGESADRVDGLFRASGGRGREAADTTGRFAVAECG